MSVLPLPTRRWTRLEYEQVIDLGVFKREEHLELLDGQVLVRPARGPRHATVARAAHAALRAAFGTSWDVRLQRPAALDDVSEPEPDICVVPRGGHGWRPARPVLVVEVTDTRRGPDRRKSGLYARAAVDEVWIVNLVDDVLEVYRDPEFLRSAAFRWIYADTRVLERDQSITPVAAPDVRIRVAELLP